jgi:putative ABC transport system substrate-binding protein
MVADLVQRQVDVILAIGPPAVIAAKAVTHTIPIIFVTGADPLKFGFVASFTKPGANITGVWMVLTVLAEKRLQLLHELFPKAELIGLLVNPSSPVAEPQIREAQAAANALGVRVTVPNAVTDTTSIRRSQASPNSIPTRCSSAPIHSSPARVSASPPLQHNMPCRPFMNSVNLSKLVTHEVRNCAQRRHYKGGRYVGRVLQGTTPAELPVEKVDKFELILNLKTGKALGLDIPPTLLGRADEVIE